MKKLTASRIDLDTLERETGFGCTWFIALGIGLITLGGLAFLSLPAAATVSVYAVGIVMLIAAFAKLGTLLLVPDWRGTGHLALSAVLYGAAGILVIANPTFAAKTLTLMLALALIFSGAMRIWLSVVMPYLPGWGWIGASGLVSVAAGAVFINLWPAGVWLLGMVLAVDLTFQGVMMIAFGIGLRASQDNGNRSEGNDHE
jgi:uncharacterized membrane protein HdeD (DUF308 family)